MSYELKNIKVLGFTTDYQKCDCCGKDNLKGTVSILDLSNDVVLHFGTTCATKADKYDNLNAYNLAKKEVFSIKKHIQQSTAFAITCSNIFGIKDVDTLIKDYLKFLEVPENRTKRFNWEAYK